MLHLSRVPADSVFPASLAASPGFHVSKSAPSLTYFSYLSSQTHQELDFPKFNLPDLAFHSTAVEAIML
jgi:hypothetical protein